MTFWKGVQRAFGFGHDTEEDDDYNPSGPTYAANPQPSADEPAAAAQPSALTDEEMLAGEIFDAVIEKFNAVQPEFVKSCLSVQAEREYLLRSMSDNLRSRLLVAPTAPAEPQRDPKEAEAEKKATDELQKENARLRLSLDRQKRALLDRVNQLESQLDKMRENAGGAKALVADTAKLDMANAQIAELEAKIANLESALEESNKATQEAEAQAAKAAEEAASQVAKAAEEAAAAAVAEAETAGSAADKETIAVLTAEISALKSGTERLESEVAGMAAEVAALRAELKSQITQREQLEMKTAMSDEMINSLRNSAAAARNEVERLTAERDELIAEQETAMRDIYSRLEEFEALKSRLETRITELQDALKAERSEERQERIAKLNEENASLRHTIENNIYSHASAEMKLRGEIKRLQAENDELRDKMTNGPAPTAAEQKAPDYLSYAAAANAAETSEPAPKRRGRPKKAKIDADLNNADWFTGAKNDPDFGYHEPPRRPSNGNEAQLSLF